MEFARSKEGIFLNQWKYILDLLTDTGMTGCKAAETPMDPNVKLKSAVEDEIIDRERYQRLAGRLIYLSHTMPDIAFVVSVISQFMHAPGPAHFLWSCFQNIEIFKANSRKRVDVQKQRAYTG